jgi:hypothetical protein
MLMVLFFARVRALARGISLAFWEVVPKGRGCALVTVELQTIPYPAFHCPSRMKELPSINQV